LLAYEAIILAIANPFIVRMRPFFLVRLR
jgi:hypothetical protein